MWLKTPLSVCSLGHTPVPTGTVPPPLKIFPFPQVCLHSRHALFSFLRLLLRVGIVGTGTENSVYSLGTGMLTRKDAFASLTSGHLCRAHLPLRPSGSLFC